MKTLLEEILEKKFSSVQARNKWLRTIKVKIGSNTHTGHNYDVGDIVDLEGATLPIGNVLYYNSSISAIRKPNGKRGNNIWLCELYMVPQTQAELKSQIAKLREDKKKIDNQINELNDRIKFMKEKKIKNFDEATFKNWRVLKEIKANMDNLDSYEFAETLTKLING